MKSIRAGYCWVYELFEHVQNFGTNLPKLHGREEHCSNWLSLSLSFLEWPRMTRNDHSNKFELSIRPHSGVDSAQWDWGITRWPNLTWWPICIWWPIFDPYLVDEKSFSVTLIYLLFTKWPNLTWWPICISDDLFLTLTWLIRNISQWHWSTFTRWPMFYQMTYFWPNDLLLLDNMLNPMTSFWSLFWLQLKIILISIKEYANELINMHICYQIMWNVHYEKRMLYVNTFCCSRHIS